MFDKAIVAIKNAKNMALKFARTMERNAISIKNNTKRHLIKSLMQSKFHENGLRKICFYKNYNKLVLTNLMMRR